MAHENNIDQSIKFYRYILLLQLLSASRRITDYVQKTEGRANYRKQLTQVQGKNK